MIRVSTIVAFLIVCTSHLRSEVCLWDVSSGGSATITGDDVEIFSAGTYKFEAVTTCGSSTTLANIDNIIINPSVTGTVTVYIESRADNNTPGALNVGSIDLTNTSGVTGELAELRITGDLGTTGPVVVHHIGGVVSVVGAVQDSITINGDLSGDITATATQAVTVNGGFPSQGSIFAPVIGDLTVQGIAGDITGTTSIGNITIGNGTNVACSITGGTIGTINITGSHNGSISATGSIGNVDITQYLSGSITAGSLGTLTTHGTSSTSGGSVTVNSNHSAAMTIPSRFSGDVLIDGTYSGFASFGSASTHNFTGTFTVNVDLTGRIDISGDLAAPNGRIDIGGDANNTANPPIRIHGSISGTGATAPLISIGDQLNGTIAVDGALANANTGGSADEILITGSLGTLGAVAINYDGTSAALNDWTSGATITIGANGYDGTNGNNATDRCWNVSPCAGDLNGDRTVDSNDNATVEAGDSSCNTPPATTGPLFCVARSSESQYRSLFPGLEGSRVWHGDCNFSTGFGTDDQGAFTNVIGFTSCCLTEFQDPCPGDVGESVSGTCRFDYDVDLGDLAALLSGYGTSSGATRCQGDLSGDGDVDLSDLALLLANFGNVCCPLTCCSTPSTASVSISVAGFDSGSYVGGGFYGEKYHFVFDVLTAMNDSDDDWVGSGVAVTTANGATFRLVPSAGNPPVPTSSTPEKYATFFSVPYAVNANNRFNSPFPTGGIAGGYDPVSSSYVYSSSDVNAAWYDMNSTSNDGPAAVFRVVIDVSGVSGADTSGGFGSVYFTTGTPGSGDIKVADMTFEVEHKYDDSGSTTVSGSFYVTD